MSYTPRTFTNKAGTSFDPAKTQVIYAEDLNYIFDTLNSLANNFSSMARAWSSFSLLSIAPGSPTQIKFDKKTFDLNDDYDTGHRKFICPLDGQYKVSCSVEIIVSDINRIHTLYIYKNGTPVSSKLFFCSTPLAYSVLISDILDCTAGDELEIYILNTGTGVMKIMQSQVDSHAEYQLLRANP